VTGSLHALSPRLAQLIRLLGSDKDGEILSAARAIFRTLASAGLSLHELAALVEEAAAPAAIALPMERARGADQSAAADILANYTGMLTTWDREFLRSIAHWRGSLTLKQRAKVTAICERIQAAGARRGAA
jgi:hypothetical protein